MLLKRHSEEENEREGGSIRQHASERRTTYAVR
jgi:hypothetical protein